MRKVVRFLLPISQVFALCGCIAGLGAGVLVATLGAGLVCFDSCPTPEYYFPNLRSGSIRVMIPCIALELLALLIFATYCVAMGQVRRAIRKAVILLVGGLVGVAALGALMRQGQASLPLTSWGNFVERPVEDWASQWGVALMVVAGAWSGVLAYLQGTAE